MTKPLNSSKKEIAYHYYTDKNISLRERGYYEEIVSTPSDFNKDQIFFVSLVAQNWIPFHLKDTELGCLQLIHFKYNKKLILTKLEDYHDLFKTTEGSNQYVLSDEGKILVDLGFDFISFEDGLEISECFIANPREQVTKIDTITLRRK